MLKSLIIRENQIKTTMQYHYTSITVTNTEAGKDIKQPKLSYIAVGMQNTTATLENDSTISYQVKKTLIIDLKIPLPSIY